MTTHSMSQLTPSSPVLPALSSSSHTISPLWAIVVDWLGLENMYVVKGVTRHNAKDILPQQFGEHAKLCPSSFHNGMHALQQNQIIDRDIHLFMLHLVCDLLTDP